MDRLCTMLRDGWIYLYRYRYICFPNAMRRWQASDSMLYYGINMTPFSSNVANATFNSKYFALHFQWHWNTNYRPKYTEMFLQYLRMTMFKETKNRKQQKIQVIWFLFAFLFNSIQNYYCIFNLHKLALDFFCRVCERLHKPKWKYIKISFRCIIHVVPRRCV